MNDSPIGVHANRTVVVAAIVITATGIVRVWTGRAPPGTGAPKVLLAGYVVVLVLAAFDTFVPQSHGLVSAFATMAMVAVLFASGLVQWIAGLFAPGASGGGGATTFH